MNLIHNTSVSENELCSPAVDNYTNSVLCPKTMVSVKKSRRISAKGED